MPNHSHPAGEKGGSALAFQPPKQVYSGKIREVTLGEGPRAVTLGGRGVYAFHSFEGEIPRPPRVAMEVWDKDPGEDWSEAAKAPFGDLLKDPAAWAKKCVEDYGADAIVVQTKSADPNADNRPAVEVADAVKRIVDAVDVPVIVWGVAAHDKDTEVMREVAQKCGNRRIAVAPVEDGDYKPIGAACLGYGHTVVASSPIDVNMSKQLNILLANLGLSNDRILIDPTTGGLGYGLEYSYSVMERISQAALTQEDEKLQQPMICEVGNEIWKSKEANLSLEDAPELGDPQKRGVLMEAVTAVTLLMAGADMVVLRHPDSVVLVKNYIATMTGSESVAASVPAEKAPAHEVPPTTPPPAPRVEVKERRAPEPVREKPPVVEHKPKPVAQAPPPMPEVPKPVPAAVQVPVEPAPEAIKVEPKVEPAPEPLRMAKPAVELKKAAGINPRDVSACESTVQMLEKIAKDGHKTAFDRAAEMKPCPIGVDSACCKNCFMGPCRLNPNDPYSKVGVCGATIDTIAARNFARMVAAGSAAHTDHGMVMLETFREVVNGNIEGYGIKDEKKLRSVAESVGIPVADREVLDIAKDLYKELERTYTQVDGEIPFAKRVPPKTLETWRKEGVVPRGAMREIMEMMHRTHMGVDQDYENIVRQCSRTALADGWGGSMVATEISDILFGTPRPLVGEVNMGCLKEDHVNIIIHGHEPMLFEAMMIAVGDPARIEQAKVAGAKGFQLVGMCCSGGEMLARHGIPHAGNFLSVEPVIATGAVDAMAVDVQCIMQALPTMAECYGTRFFTTNPRARIEGADHIEFNEHHPEACVNQIIDMAVERFRNRPGRVVIPKRTDTGVHGFSHEYIEYMLGGEFRGSYVPLNETIMNGRIRGVAGVVGCNNPRVRQDHIHVEVVKELIRNDILVVQTGCAQIALAKAGLMKPDAATLAGEGLREVCETVGIPPVLSLGSCVDNSRILMACAAMVRTGGIGNSIAELPVAGCAPEYMSEKAVTIGHYFVASGVYTVFGVTFPTIEGTKFHKLLFEGLEESGFGKWGFALDPHDIAQLMIAHIDKKRAALGITGRKERKLFSMEDRREGKGTVLGLGCAGKG